MASWIANARPRPMLTLACASIVSRAGERTALPNRSVTTRADAGATAWATAISGTETIVIA